MRVLHEPTLFFLSIALLLLLQAGFLLFESGSVRERNTFNTAAKNFCDFFVGTATYLLFTVLFRGKVEIGPGSLVMALFCATALTIASGAVAERFRIRPYLSLVIFSAAVTFPLIENWAWASEGWLNLMGFVDRAGAVVVHVTGGCVALAAAMVVGPRTGRFSPTQRGVVASFPSSNLVVSCFGCLLIVVGMLGFNTASLTAEDPGVMACTIVTLLAALGGGAFGIVLSMSHSPTVTDVMRPCVCSLAGVVAITGAFPFVNDVEAICIGILGAVAHELVSRLLLRFRVDDALQAVSVHLGGGAVGGLAVAWGVQEQLLVQLLGTVVVGSVAFGFTYLFLWVYGKFSLLRPTVAEEELGLNLSEHNSPSLADELMTTMRQHSQKVVLGQRARVEPHTTVGRIAETYNGLLQEMEASLTEKVESIRERDQSKILYESLLHDLRNPLQSLAGQAFQLEQGVVKEAAAVRSAGSFVETQVRQMNTLIDAALSGLRMKLPRQESPGCDLHRALQKVEAMFQFRLDQMHAVFSHSEFTGETVRMSEAEVVRVFSNLLDNSLQALKENSQQKGSIAVSIETQLSRNCVICHYRDSGPGIPAEVGEQVFEAYLTTKRNGTGLGLASCRRLLREAGGDIVLVSGEPLHFQISFPVV